MHRARASRSSSTSTPRRSRGRAAPRASTTPSVRRRGSSAPMLCARGRCCWSSRRPEPVLQRVRGIGPDWELALDALAAAEPAPGTALRELIAPQSAVGRVPELVVVTGRPEVVADALVARAAMGRSSALVAVDAPTYAGRPPARTSPALLRLAGGRGGARRPSARHAAPRGAGHSSSEGRWLTVSPSAPCLRQHRPWGPSCTRGRSSRRPPRQAPSPWRPRSRSCPRSSPTGAGGRSRRLPSARLPSPWRSRRGRTTVCETPGTACATRRPFRPRSTRRTSPRSTASSSSRRSPSRSSRRWEQRAGAPGSSSPRWRQGSASPRCCSRTDTRFSSEPSHSARRSGRRSCSGPRVSGAAWPVSRWPGRWSRSLPGSPSPASLPAPGRSTGAAGTRSPAAAPATSASSGTQATRASTFPSGRP